MNFINKSLLSLFAFIALDYQMAFAMEKKGAPKPIDNAGNVRTFTSQGSLDVYMKTLEMLAKKETWISF